MPDRGVQKKKKKERELSRSLMDTQEKKYSENSAVRYVLSTIYHQPQISARL